MYYIYTSWKITFKSLPLPLKGSSYYGKEVGSGTMLLFAFLAHCY
jgi:hypothetical protein